MTREEAKEYIREWCPYDRQEEIIKALEQKPCEDVISRKATIKYLCTNMNWHDEDGEIADDEEKLNAITDLVNGVPSVTQEPWKDKCIKEINHLRKYLGKLETQIVEQEPKSEWQQDHEILKAYSDGANDVLDKIKAEIESKYESIPDTFHHYETGYTDALEWVLSIIDKYKAEGSGEE